MKGRSKRERAGETKDEAEEEKREQVDSRREARTNDASALAPASCFFCHTHAHAHAHKLATISKVGAPAALLPVACAWEMK